MIWKTISYLTVVAVVSGVLFSCYKTKNFSTNLTAQIDTAIVAQSYDQARVTTIIDEIFNDVDSVMGNQASDGTINLVTLCGTQITWDTALNFITITYNGYSCDNSRNRGGSVTIYYTAGTSWKNQYDTIGVNFNKFIIAGPTNSDTNHVQLNGIFYYANTSGGSLSTLTSGSTPITHVILSPTLGVLFNSADTATWQVARKRTYTNSGSGITITTTGIDTVGGIPNVAEWGGNRYANSFINAISTTSPLISTAGCNYRIISGQTTLTNPTGVTTLTYGLDASGSAATACPASGGNYFQFSWTGSDSGPYSSVRLFPYW